MKVGLSGIENIEKLEGVLEAISERYLRDLKRMGYDPSRDVSELWNSFIRREIWRLTKNSPDEVKEHFDNIEEQERENWSEKLVELQKSRGNDGFYR